MSNRRQTPNEFLKQIIGRPVVVKLNNGVDYRGKLCNVVLTSLTSSLPLSFLTTSFFTTFYKKSS